MPTRAKRALMLALLVTTSGANGCKEPPERSEQAGGERQPAEKKRTATVPADGWNDDIAWRGLDEGLREAKQSGMPLMLVVHTQWCGNCQKLKPSFASEPLAQLSEQFVMVHVDQDAQPDVTLYSPDGQYIPRVLFLDSNGNIDSQLQNPNRRDRYRYFYTPQDDLVASMREALDRHGKRS